MSEVLGFALAFQWDPQYVRTCNYVHHSSKGVGVLVLVLVYLVSVPGACILEPCSPNLNDPMVEGWILEVTYPREARPSSSWGLESSVLDSRGAFRAL